MGIDGFKCYRVVIELISRKKVNGLETALWHIVHVIFPSSGANRIVTGASTAVSKVAVMRIVHVMADFNLKLTKRVVVTLTSVEVA